MRTLRCLLALMIISLTSVGPLFAEPGEPVTLWPDGAPGETGDIGEEHDITQPNSGKPAGGRVIRLGNVSVPTLTLFPAPAETNTGAAVLVCPGGGYHILAYDLEGTEVCAWLNSIGVNAVLLKYRVPARKNRPRYAAPLEDAQRAMGLIRANAAQWGIDPNRVGVMGFSAGGHLSATLCSKYAKRAYEAVDGADALPCRPDFSMLIYPAYLTVKDQPGVLPPEIKIDQNTPPAFLAQSQDDRIKVECSIYYYLKLHEVGVPAAMHIYPTGGHGYGLRRTENPVTSWSDRAADWMRSMGFLDKP